MPNGVVGGLTVVIELVSSWQRGRDGPREECRPKLSGEFFDSPWSLKHVKPRCTLGPFAIEPGPCPTRKFQRVDHADQALELEKLADGGRIRIAFVSSPRPHGISVDADDRGDPGLAGQQRTPEFTDGGERPPTQVVTGFIHRRFV